VVRILRRETWNVRRETETRTFDFSRLPVDLFVK
jgi:hypothetical protein